MNVHLKIVFPYWPRTWSSEGWILKDFRTKTGSSCFNKREQSSSRSLLSSPASSAGACCPVGVYLPLKDARENSRSSASTWWSEQCLTKEIWSSHLPLEKEQDKREKRWKNLTEGCFRQSFTNSVTVLIPYQLLKTMVLFECFSFAFEVIYCNYCNIADFFPGYFLKLSFRLLNLRKLHSCFPWQSSFTKCLLCTQRITQASAGGGGGTNGCHDLLLERRYKATYQ